MDLRCLIFSSDETAAPLICQALAELGAEADRCTDAAAAIGRVASESFQIVIADWDEQPNAEYLLKAARARKPTERALTLAVVSDDASVPKALQAGANSVLRKPILLNQVKDTLETARSLLKAKQDAGTSASPGQNSSPIPARTLPENQTQLRAGDFLASTRSTPSAQFDTESELQKEMVPSAGAIDPLKDLEPMAAAVTPERTTAAPPMPSTAAAPEGPRGLQWYLNQRTSSLPSTPTAPMPAPPAPQPPKLMGYDQMATRPEAVPENTVEPSHAPRPLLDPVREQKAEAELFSYITHGSGDSASDSQLGGSGFHLGKRALIFALALTACAIVVAPQAPWHPATRRLWARGQRSLHVWLNPQVVEPAQTPETHEDFARAGDEYKLPVAENIPDATTDPSQIRVVPVVDPTAKKPGNNGADQTPDGTVAPADSTQPSDGQGAGAPVQANTSQAASASPSQAGPPQGNSSSTGSPTALPLPAQPPISLAPVTRPVPQAASSSTSAPQAAITVSSRPTQKSNPSVVAVANSIPSSLKSQMASSVPDASGNKSPDTALPTIEPVAVPETAERALITARPAIAYPTDAKGQQGTVILQLLIGRDGAVEDAKFLQGSLAFARAAIDGVRSWKFKPYLLNGRPVSVQTQLTLIFTPGK